MSHLPINHHMRPFYRVLSGLTGICLVVFGVVAWAVTGGGDWFGPGDGSALGLSTNRGFAVISVLAGVVVLAAAVVGRNLDRSVNLVGAAAFMLVGTVTLPLLGTEANLLNFSIVTVCVSYLVGTVLLVCGLYTKTAPAHDRVGEVSPEPGLERASA